MLLSSDPGAEASRVLSLLVDLFPKQELLGFSIHTTTGRWTR